MSNHPGGVLVNRRLGEIGANRCSAAADHVVQNTQAFIAGCRQGLAAAQAGRIVTFGIRAERAATEYGYINPGEVVAGEVHAVVKFVEKPDAATAADYVKSGYLWNSGNFMFPAAVLLEEYRKVDAELFAQNGGIDILTLIKWRELYAWLEATVDACKETAHVISGIVIKGS